MRTVKVTEDVNIMDEVKVKARKNVQSSRMTGSINLYL